MFMKQLLKQLKIMDESISKIPDYKIIEEIVKNAWQIM